jgi:8-oxo-dGTP pyrophosphatase MutT (NUDIX family)
LPYAGIGVSVIMETLDGLIPLTRRGIETPVYPAMLYSPGGGPKPGEGTTEALLQEILEETGLRAGEDFDPNSLFMMALIADTRFAGSSHSRPELVARLPVNVTYLELEKIQQERVRAKGLKETDVWGLEPVSTYPPSLHQVIKLHGYEMCPPTEAALTYEYYEIRKRVVGEDAAYQELADFIQIIGGYEREEFVPPIKRLAG